MPEGGGWRGGGRGVLRITEANWLGIFIKALLENEDYTHWQGLFFTYLENVSFVNCANVTSADRNSTVL
jgi:hypothetical protein